MGANINVRIAVHDNKDRDKNCSKHATEHGMILEGMACFVHDNCAGARFMPTTTNHFQKIIVVEELQEVYDEDNNYYYIF
jgi:hypothetical protein